MEWAGKRMHGRWAEDRAVKKHDCTFEENMDAAEVPSEEWQCSE